MQCQLLLHGRRRFTAVLSYAYINDYSCFDQPEQHCVLMRCTGGAAVRAL